MHQVSMQLGIKYKTCGSNQNKKLYSWHNFQLIVSEKNNRKSETDMLHHYLHKRKIAKD